MERHETIRCLLIVEQRVDDWVDRGSLREHLIVVHYDNRLVLLSEIMLGAPLRVRPSPEC